MPNPLTHLRQLHEAATSAPWELIKDAKFNWDKDDPVETVPNRYISIKPQVVEYAECGSHRIKIKDGDALLIAEMRNLLPSLLDALEDAARKFREINGRDLGIEGYLAEHWLKEHAHLFEDRGE